MNKLKNLPMLKTDSAITEEYINALKYFVEFTRLIAGVPPIHGVNKQNEKKLIKTLNTRGQSASSAAAAYRKLITKTN